MRKKKEFEIEVLKIDMVYLLFSFGTLALGIITIGIAFCERQNISLAIGMTLIVNASIMIILGLTGISITFENENKIRKKIIVKEV